ncbi:ScbR family autoregulator-binding transcription factor [Wenjunlia tyrosinilytica]|uniref:Gamma-butyrolactone-binding protein n=1 Tax=Wenjunlia tyrosinilytica TaxID=1544741 RepID=A0A917ZWQ0_9ACTN|nr:ScbR family autoregulator-binding transcription factor [Wenjunlia tyrosinilytica]GGO94291.1 gamma-butyrolactone-binding protein [Wenjunlia tyrosinilytica]
MAQQERAIRTRRAILEAAGSVFDESGYDSATLSTILERAGVTKGALYFHFPSKEKLALAVLNEHVDEVQAPSQPTKLQELVDAGMILAHRLSCDPILRGGTRLTIEQGVAKHQRRGPLLAWRDHNLQLLTEAKERGELLPHVVLEDTAALFVGAFTGLQLMSQILSDRADLEDRVVVMFNHILPSIAVPALLGTLDISADRARDLMGKTLTTHGG